MTLLERQLKQHNKDLFVKANDRVHQERVEQETKTDFWRNMVPGESIFPWTHGEECDRQHKVQ